MINQGEKETFIFRNLQRENFYTNTNLEKKNKITKEKINSEFSIKSFLFGYIAGFSGIVTSHPFDTIKTRYQEGKRINFNLRNLYRGVTAPLIGVGLEKSLVFGTFENTKKFTNSDFISGGISGLTASLIVTPFERIKILLQTDGKINFRNFKKN